MNCRFCNNPLKHVFADLLTSPASNSYLTASQLNESEAYFPLKTFVCEKCFLVQVDEFIKHEQIFNSEYAYFSSYSESWLAHAKAYVEMMVNRFHFNERSFIVEIASNDGYLLQYFKEKNIPVVGVEPTRNTAVIAEQKGIKTIVDFFSAKFAQAQFQDKNIKADLILGNNVLAHVPDINDFVKGMKIALKETGIITMEFPHLYQLVAENQFDTIYHEHFSYLSLTTVKQIFEKQDLSIFDVQEIPTHGGSLRIFAKHTSDNSKEISTNVKKLLDKEKNAGMTSIAYYQNFQEKVNNIKYAFLNFLLSQKQIGKKVIGYGAAAKGNTLLNYCGIKGHDLIQFVVDASPHKQGKYLPGSRIPIYDKTQIEAYKPDYIIIFPWNIKSEIATQLSYCKSWGCQFVVFVPELLIS